jgi:hypothetical protein
MSRGRPLKVVEEGSGAFSGAGIVGMVTPTGCTEVPDDRAWWCTERGVLNALLEALVVEGVFDMSLD